MKNSAWRRFLWGASLQHDLDELKTIAIRYIKEETIKPLKDLWRFVLWGAIGSVFVGFGAVLLLVWRAALPAVAVSGPRRLALVAALRHRGRSRSHRDGAHRLAHREWHRQATLESSQVSEPSATRRELEASLRSFLPKEVQIGGSLIDSKPTVAAVGVGEFSTGYVWGRLRGRRLRKAKNQKQTRTSRRRDPLDEDRRLASLSPRPPPSDVRGPSATQVAVVGSRCVGAATL